jgi:hypothetical protein
MKQLDRLMFLQGGLCFFCERPLAAGDASVEHLFASANGGTNSEGNCVACCKALNTLFGDKSLKEKLQVVLNQRGQFKCPKGTVRTQPIGANQAPQADDKLALVVADLQKRGSARPRKVTTLRNTINAALKKQLTEEEISSVMEQLQARGIIVVSDTKVTYDLPPKSV